MLFAPPPVVKQRLRQAFEALSPPRSQAEVADLLGVAQSAVAQWLSDKTSSIPHRDRWNDVATVFGRTVPELFLLEEGVPDHPPEAA